jgi:hypothetical protein
MARKDWDLAGRLGDDWNRQRKRDLRSDPLPRGAYIPFNSINLAKAPMMGLLANFALALVCPGWLARPRVRPTHEADDAEKAAA